MTEVYLIKVSSALGKVEERTACSAAAISRVKCIAARLTGISEGDIIIKKTELGKPYFENIKALHFNISHSSSFAAAAVSRFPIGVDIEILRKANMRAADRVFTAEERKYIYEKQSESDRRFFELWTKKEAFLKRNGLTLKSISSAETDGIFTTEMQGCILSVCCDDPDGITVISV